MNVSTDYSAIKPSVYVDKTILNPHSIGNCKVTECCKDNKIIQSPLPSVSSVSTTIES